MKKKNQASSSSRRPKVSQSDYPIFTLEQSIKLPQALWDEFAGTGAAPHQVAIALGRAPTSGDWRNLCGSALAYGLVDGGYNATKMTLTPLGRRIVAPTSEGDDVAARVEAVLQPRIMQAFLRKYDRGKFPSNTIAENVFVELGLPKERAKVAREVLEKNARFVGIIQDTKTGPFVALDDVTPPTPAIDSSADIATDSVPARSSMSDAMTPDAAPVSDSRREQSPRGPTASVRSQALSRNMVVDCYKLKQRLGTGFSAESGQRL